jgi:hypothetical protein
MKLRQNIDNPEDWLTVFGKPVEIGGTPDIPPPA